MITLKDKTKKVGVNNADTPKTWEDAYRNMDKKVADVAKNIDVMNVVIVGVVIVLFVTFLTFLRDDYKYKVEMYKDYKREVRALNDRLDKLPANNRESKVLWKHR